jgi:hypothetical protein
MVKTRIDLGEVQSFVEILYALVLIVVALQGVTGDIPWKTRVLFYAHRSCYAISYTFNCWGCELRKRYWMEVA